MTVKKRSEYIEERKGITYYKGEPFTGEIFENYKNGQLKYKSNFKDGKKDGLSESYYENGQLEIKQTTRTENMMVYMKLLRKRSVSHRKSTKDGEQDGLYENYYENGQLKVKETIKTERMMVYMNIITKTVS